MCMPTYGNPSRASILLFFYKKFLEVTVRGELSAGLVTDCFYIQGWTGRGQTRPDKTV